MVAGPSKPSTLLQRFGSRSELHVHWVHSASNNFPRKKKLLHSLCKPWSIASGESNVSKKPHFYDRFSLCDVPHKRNLYLPLMKRQFGGDFLIASHERVFFLSSNIIQCFNETKKHEFKKQRSLCFGCRPSNVAVWCSGTEVRCSPAWKPQATRRNFCDGLELYVRVLQYCFCRTSLLRQPSRLSSASWSSRLSTRHFLHSFSCSQPSTVVLLAERTTLANNLRPLASPRIILFRSSSPKISIAIPPSICDPWVATPSFQSRSRCLCPRCQIVIVQSTLTAGPPLDVER